MAIEQLARDINDEVKAELTPLGYKVEVSTRETIEFRGDHTAPPEYFDSVFWVTWNV